MTSPPRPASGEAATDAELLAAHVAGDPGAFGELFARHRDRLWAVALRTTGNPDDAADGLQDAMVAAFRRAGSFRGDSAVTTWLHRVVVNACLDRLRAAKVRAAVPLPDDLDRAVSRSAVGPGGPGATGPGTAGSADPERAVLDAERRDRVAAALARLPVEQRAALVLVDMEGYPVAEVAQMLDCAPGTVKSRCSRGRARLAELLADLLTEEAPAGAPAGAPADPPAGGGPGNRTGRPAVPPPGDHDPDHPSVAPRTQQAGEQDR